MIAIPCLNDVPTKFMMSLIALQQYKIGGVDINVVVVEDSMTYTARTQLASMALQDQYDFILWIDSDMVFPRDMLYRMLMAGKETVTGLYFQRRGNHKPVIYKRCEVLTDHSEDDRLAITEVYEDYPTEGLFKVAACGFGAVLMHTEAIRRVARENNGCVFDPLPGLGEDLSFCDRYAKTGGEIWCDPTIKLGHVGRTIFTEEDWKKNVVR
jgi:GT2 family glycosyltransferase